MIAIVIVTIFSSLLALINLGNETAFNGTISLVLVGFYVSYLLALTLLLWRRVRGDMGDSTTSTMTSFSSASPSETLEHHLSWGPWRLKGSWGTANNAVACCYLVLLIFFCVWPADSVIASDASNMNWASLVTGVVLLFSIVYYLVWAKKSYTGPIVEIDLDSPGDVRNEHYA